MVWTICMNLSISNITKLYSKVWKHCMNVSLNNLNYRSNTTIKVLVIKSHSYGKYVHRFSSEAVVSNCHVSSINNTAPLSYYITSIYHSIPFLHFKYQQYYYNIINHPIWFIYIIPIPFMRYFFQSEFYYIVTINPNLLS